MVANTAAAPQLLTLAASLPAQYRRKAAWLMHTATSGEAERLVDAQDRYLLPLGRLPDDRFLLGAYPVAWSDFMPQDGVQDSQVIAFGDLSLYRVVTRNALTLRALRERDADTDQVRVIVWHRVGGALTHVDALRVGYVHS